MLKLKNDLKKRKYDVIKFLYNFFIIISFLVLIYDFLLLVFFKTNPSFFVIVITFLMFCFFCFGRFFLINRNLKVSTYVLMSLLLLYGVFSIVTRGTVQPCMYVIGAIIIVTTSIVLSVKSSVGAFILFVVSTITVLILHNLEVINYQPDLTTSSIPSTIIFLALIGILTIISYIGFKEIDYSYNKAYIYAKKLEKLNKNLEKKVEIKTKKLKESYKTQSDILYKQAIVGSITQPMLHDIATPMTVISGCVDLLEDCQLEDENQKESIKIIKQAFTQMENIIDNSKNLMKNQECKKKFSPYEEINNAIFVLKNKLNRNDIVIKIKVDREIKLKGYSELFNRIVSNILLNDIEELEESKKDLRCIEIDGFKKDDFFKLEIRDNGRGIPNSVLDNIFNANFTSKKGKHMGFGLPFVKDILEKKFRGNISVDTKVGEYTKFIIEIPFS